MIRIALSLPELKLRGARARPGQPPHPSHS